MSGLRPSGFGPSMYMGSDTFVLFSFYAELDIRKYKYCTAIFLVTSVIRYN